jgi:RNA polymerase sigma-70 factor (ECF subfamily)
VPADDQTLVRQALRGDREAFGALVERYAGLVHGVVLEVVRRPEEVEDLVQDAFCRAYEGLGSLRDTSRFAPWVAQIARNVSLTHAHRERGRGLRERMEGWVWPVAPVPAPDEAVEEEERAALVWEALDQLGPEERQVVVLRHLEGCSYREIARFLGRSVATVRWRLIGAERRLSQKLLAGLKQQVPAGAGDRQRLRRQVLAALPAGLVVQRQAEVTALGAWAWLGKAASSVVSPPALVVVGLGSAGAYLASGGLGQLAGFLEGGPPAQHSPARTRQAKVTLSAADTTLPELDGVAVRHQVPPPPLAMDAPNGQIGVTGLAPAAWPSAARAETTIANSSPPPPRATPAAPRPAELVPQAMRLLLERLQQPEAGSLPDLLRRVGEDTGLPPTQVAAGLDSALDRLDKQAQASSDAWGRLVLVGGQEVPVDKAEKLLRSLAREAAKALDSRDSVRIAGVVDRAAQKSGVMPTVGRAYLVRVLAGELKVEAGTAIDAPPSAGKGGDLTSFPFAEAKSSYPVVPLVAQVRRAPDRNANPVVRFFGIADEPYVREQVTDVHQAVLTHLGRNSKVLSLGGTWIADRGMVANRVFHQLVLDVSALDFRLDPDQLGDDGRPLAVAVMRAKVGDRLVTVGPGVPSPKVVSVNLNKSIVVRIASPRSGGRNTLDGLCQKAAEEIAALLEPLRSSE